MWPNKKFKHINYESIFILKHPSLKKTEDLETRGTAFVYSIFVSSFYHSLRSMDLFSLNQAVFFFLFFRGGGWRKSTLFSLSLSPLPLEIGIPDRKMELISETTVGYQVHDAIEIMNSLIWVFCCIETRQTFRATWTCINLCLNAMFFYFFKDIFQYRGETVIFIESLFVADGFNFGTKADDD